MEKGIFDIKRRIKKEFSKEVIIYLCSLTKKGNQSEVGEAFGVSGAVVSQMKKKEGRTYIGRKHLERFAEKIGVSIGDLIKNININLNLRSSSEYPKKNHGQNGHEVWVIALVDVDPFLTSLKKAIGGFDVNSLFIAKLNGSPVWADVSNITKFDQTGCFPSWWLSLIKNKQERQQITNRFQCRPER